MLAGELLEEVLGEGGDVAVALAQRGQGDREHVEAVVEVLAERPGRDRRGEVLVRRGDEAHVGLERLGPAEALVLARLQHPQELDLRGQRQVADLVEEQRAALRAIEPPLLAPDGAGEGAALVAEELRLEQRLGERGAVDLDEGLAARSEFAWMACATSSLPVPDSPRMSAVAEVRATCAISS